MTLASLARSLIAIILLSHLAAGVARAEPCSREIARSAVETAADIVGRLGVEAARNLIDPKEGKLSCGPYSIKVIDYKGTWLIDPDENSNVGRNVASFNDGAALNFMKSLIKAAIEGRGKITGYFTTDTEGEIKINKALYYVDIQQHKAVVYGAFIITR